METTSERAVRTGEDVRARRGSSGTRRFAKWRRLAVPALLLGLLFGCASPPEPESNSIDIQGSIISKDGLPVPGIVVQVEGSDRSGLSGADGRFVLADVPAGELDLVIGTRVPVNLSAGAFVGAMNNQVIVRLDGEGEAANVDIVRGDCVSTVLLRPAATPSPNGQAKIGIEAEAEFEELAVRLERVRENARFDVFLQSDPAQRGSLVPIGSIQTVGAANDDPDDGVGTLSFSATAEMVSATMPFGVSVVSLQGRRIEIRDANGVVQLVGSVPAADPEGNSEVERDDLQRVGGPEDARGNVRIKATPDCSRDNFWVQIKGLERRTTYEICINCNGPAKATADAQGDHVEGTPTYRLSDATAGQDDEVVLALTLDTAGESVIFAQAVLEYDSAALTFVGATLGTDASGWLLTPNTNLPFGTQTPGTNENVLVQLAHPMGAAFNGLVEVARLRFRTSATLTGTTCVSFDPCKNECSPPGQLHTFVSLEGPVPPLGGDDDLNLESGCITIREFDCFEVTTSQGGEAHLFLKKKQCDILPCGVECMRDLQGAAIEVREAGSGAVVLAGNVPWVD